jgi:hypothetical protein
MVPANPLKLQQQRRDPLARRGTIMGLKQVRSQEIEERTIALCEVARAPVQREAENLWRRRRQAARHLVLQPRGPEHVLVDLAPLECTLAHEIRDLERARVGLTSSVCNQRVLQAEARKRFVTSSGEHLGGIDDHDCMPFPRVDLAVCGGISSDQLPQLL